MNLRHLRCFIAVAEELHFGRAARRLHVEQSPLSRTIRQLEADLGVTLLERTPRGVRLTPAGQVFLEEARRVLLTLEQAQTKARAVAAGHRGTLRIALAGGVGRTRLSALLALCREEAPEVGIRLFEAPLSQVVGGLGNDLYDAAFAMAGEMEAGVIAMPVWQDPLVVAIPARHPLLAHERVPLEEVVGGALAACGSLLVGRDIRVDLPDGLPLLHLDAVLIERVLVNLLENASKYTPAGSAIHLFARSRSDTEPLAARASTRSRSAPARRA